MTVLLQILHHDHGLPNPDQIGVEILSELRMARYKASRVPRRRRVLKEVLDVSIRRLEELIMGIRDASSSVEGREAPWEADPHLSRPQPILDLLGIPQLGAMLQDWKGLRKSFSESLVGSAPWTPRRKSPKSIPELGDFAARLYKRLTGFVPRTLTTDKPIYNERAFRLTAILLNLAAKDVGLPLELSREDVMSRYQIRFDMPP